MTKEELRTQYVDAGWEVQPVAAWAVVSQIEDKTKYDVNVVSPANKFGTAQVVEDSTGAVALGFWENKEADFSVDLRTFLDSKEGGQVYAIAVNQVFESDEVALVTVYQGNSIVIAKNYVVKKRSETFDFKEVTTI